MDEIYSVDLLLRRRTVILDDIGHLAAGTDCDVTIDSQIGYPNVKLSPALLKNRDNHATNRRRKSDHVVRRRGRVKTGSLQ